MKILHKYALLTSWLIFAAGLSAIFFYMNRIRFTTPSTQVIEKENNVIIILLIVTVTLSTLLNLFSVYKLFTEKMRVAPVVRLIIGNTPLLFMQCVCILGVLILSAVI